MNVFESAGRPMGKGLIFAGYLNLSELELWSSNY